MNCIKNGIKREGESCNLNNNCIYPNCTQPIKQDVYLPVKFVFTSEQLNEYTKNVIKQTLETAAEKVHLVEYGCRDNRVTNENAGQLYFVPSYYGEDNEVEISKQSITDTFEETFKQFEI